MIGELVMMPVVLESDWSREMNEEEVLSGESGRSMYGRSVISGGRFSVGTADGRSISFFCIWWRGKKSDALKCLLKKDL